jgi:hypothetical protein
VIPGWQVSGDTSRKFYFTGEKHSYGAQLGQTSNLGTIEAVFFREKQPYRVGRWSDGREKDEEKISLNQRGDGPSPDSMPAPAAAGTLAGEKQAQNEASGMARDHSKKSSSPSSASLSDELAATGIGSRTRFDVTRVDVDLEDVPAMSVRLRYEFRPQLVALGVLREPRDPIARRETGRGFSEFCPEPN